MGLAPVFCDLQCVIKPTGVYITVNVSAYGDVSSIYIIKSEQKCCQMNKLFTL